MECCLLCCESKIISNDDDYVEVKATISGAYKKLLRDEPLVNWSGSGEARFHAGCWKALLTSARARSMKNQQFQRMTAVEKTMIKDAAKTAEQHDSETIFRSEGKRIAELIKKSKYCVCFTGAGISTSAGIGDYRGKQGKWTEEDRKTSTDFIEDGPSSSKKSKMEESEEADEEGVPYEQLRPTYTHEALFKLMELNYLKYCLSQNGDGLHMLSGIPSEKLAELHGNVFVEKCEKCDSSYERSYYVMDDLASAYFEDLEDQGTTALKKPKFAVKCTLCGLSHRTGRRCEKKGCKGFLKDTIINFRDNLEEAVLDSAYKAAEESDLMLCLGTTLAVTPANELVEMGKDPQRIVICNRQKTHMDAVARSTDKKTGEVLGSRVFGDCDRLFKYIMRNIMDEKSLSKWENDRIQRMVHYESQRTAICQ